MYEDAFKLADQDDIDKRIRHYTAVIRSHKIIKEFMLLESVSPALRDKFQDWLMMAVYSAEKEIAMELVFHEVLYPVTDEMIDRLMKDLRGKQEQYG